MSRAPKPALAFVAPFAVLAVGPATWGQVTASAGAARRRTRTSPTRRSRLAPPVVQPISELGWPGRDGAHGNLSSSVEPGQNDRARSAALPAITKRLLTVRTGDQESTYGIGRDLPGLTGSRRNFDDVSIKKAATIGGARPLRGS
jgi:hypothetical protein